MASLGSEAIVGRLVAGTISAESITTNQAIQSSHKVIGKEKNHTQIHQKGSIFYLKWSHVEQITSFTTTSGSTSVTITINGHGLATGDFFTIENIGAGTPDINGIAFEDIHGARAVSAISGNDITFTAGAPATSTGTETSVQPLIRIDRYKFTDMATSDANWSYATTEPTAPHTNTSDPDFSL